MTKVQDLLLFEFGNLFFFGGQCFSLEVPCVRDSCTCWVHVGRNIYRAWGSTRACRLFCILNIRLFFLKNLQNKHTLKICYVYMTGLWENNFATIILAPRTQEAIMQWHVCIRLIHARHWKVEVKSFPMVYILPTLYEFWVKKGVNYWWKALEPKNSIKE